MKPNLNFEPVFKRVQKYGTGKSYLNLKEPLDRICHSDQCLNLDLIALHKSLAPISFQFYFSSMLRWLLSATLHWVTALTTTSSWACLTGQSRLLQRQFFSCTWSLHCQLSLTRRVSILRKFFTFQKVSFVPAKVFVAKHSVLITFYYNVFQPFYGLGTLNIINIAEHQLFST